MYSFNTLNAKLNNNTIYFTAHIIEEKNKISLHSRDSDDSNNISLDCMFSHIIKFFYFFNHPTSTQSFKLSKKQITFYH